MVFNGVNFNAAYWKTKTEAEFIKHESHHCLSETQLKEAFKLMVPEAKQPVKKETIPEKKS